MVNLSCSVRVPSAEHPSARGRGEPREMFWDTLTSVRRPAALDSADGGRIREGGDQDGYFQGPRGTGQGYNAATVSGGTKTSAEDNKHYSAEKHAR
jgi:hypothetical protein